MASETFGTTTFEHQDYSGRLMIRTAEGSTVAVPCEDVKAFVIGWWRNAMHNKIDSVPWQDLPFLMLGGR